MPDTYQHIRLHIADRTGRITFARPPLNVFNIEAMREINDALERCTNVRDMVAIVFDASADSRAWCAGIALEEHADETVYQLLEAFHDIFRNLQAMAKPVIAIVDGAALGGGCSLVAGCDIVIASERARFGQPEIKLGVFSSIAAVLLPRVVGERRAREMILTGELVGADEALRMGLVSYVVPTNDLEAKSTEILTRLRDLSAASLEASRRALDAAQGRTFNDALAQIENIYLNELMKTVDAHEGIRAFMEKRRAGWKNR
jgi:cyclohexa-1,5-dienecarbonyl-CoA hydratase